MAGTTKAKTSIPGIPVHKGGLSDVRMGQGTSLMLNLNFFDIRTLETSANYLWTDE